MLDGWQVESGSDLIRVAAKKKFDAVLELAGGDYAASDIELLVPKDVWSLSVSWRVAKRTLTSA